jgi:glycosyltransferase involved in cell wall biosynthesis
MSRSRTSDPVNISTRRATAAYQKGTAVQLRPMPGRSPAMAKAETTCRSVLMVGTHLSAQGGIRTVVQGYVDSGLMDRIPCRYVGTHCDGSTWAKIRSAIGGWARTAFLLFRMDAPLVHLHMASGASCWRKSVITLLARVARRPYVLHIHGGGFIPFYLSQHRLAQRFIHSVLANASTVIALSEAQRTALLKHFQLRATDVLPNAVSIPDHAIPRPSPEAPQTLLFLGHVLKEKGAFDLVRAFARIADRFPRLTLVCAGSGLIAQARAQAERLGVQDRVFFPGWVDVQGRDRALAAATVFVLPSYAEGLPMALLEAMAAGVPVIATPVGGIPQLVEHDVNGVLVRAGQIDALAAALTVLLADPQKQERLGRAARQTVQSGYAIGTTIEKLYAIYTRFGIAPRPAAGAPRESVKIARSGS